jgi:glycine cleavage system H protein
MSIPGELKYTRDHEWARVEGDVITVGITAFAVEQLGDVTLVDLPPVGKKVEAGKTFGVVESVKSVSDLFAPLSGEVVDTNALLSDHPEHVNEEPYGKGWMLRIRVSDAGQLATLLDAAAYAKHVEASGH